MKVADLQRAAGIQPLQRPMHPRHTRQTTQQKPVKQFGQLLQQNIKEQQKVRFSAHAIKRLEQRQLMLNEQILQRLEQGMEQLHAKGSRNSLILLDETAFVVSVPNKTVVTAIQTQEALEKVFTNIDSVAIV